MQKVVFFRKSGGSQASGDSQAVFGLAKKQPQRKCGRHWLETTTPTAGYKTKRLLQAGSVWAHSSQSWEEQLPAGG